MKKFGMTNAVQLHIKTIVTGNDHIIMPKSVGARHDCEHFRSSSQQETLEIAVINAVWCLVSDIMLILECLEWNSGSHLQYADKGD